MFGRRKRAARGIRNLRAHMRLDEEWIPVTIANSSVTGLFVKCAEPPMPGSRVEIRHRGQAITGQVIHTTGMRFGFESDDPIDLKRLFASSDIGVKDAAIEMPRRDTPWWHWRNWRGG